MYGGRKQIKDQGFESSIYITYFAKNHLNPSYWYSIKIYFIYETFFFNNLWDFL